MSCPFLREGRARYCHASSFRKLILNGPGAAEAGRCASPEYQRCELAQNAEARLPRCPSLEEICVQYCAASPVTKLVPFSESQLSPCIGKGHHYCEAYLSVARPNTSAPPPDDLLYAPNHFWLEPAEANLCHIGIDAFLCKVAGSIDAVTFVTSRGTHRPAVALTIRGVEWPMVFPNPVMIEKVNSRLRSDPSRLTADPYGAGWLFEGWEMPGRTEAGLIRSPQANAWQAEQRERLAGEMGDQQERPLSREGLVGILQRYFSNTAWSSEQ